MQHRIVPSSARENSSHRTFLGGVARWVLAKCVGRFLLCIIAAGLFGLFFCNFMTSLGLKRTTPHSFRVATPKMVQKYIHNSSGLTS
jgi:hypothetical protein